MENFRIDVFLILPADVSNRHHHTAWGKLRQAGLCINLCTLLRIPWQTNHLWHPKQDPNTLYSF
jgi:hypothetical protein